MSSEARKYGFLMVNIGFFGRNDWLFIVPKQVGKGEKGQVIVRTGVTGKAREAHDEEEGDLYPFWQIHWGGRGLFGKFGNLNFIINC